MISDAVLKGILTAREMVEPEEFSEELAELLYVSFWQGYCSQRQPDEDEMSIAGEIR